MSTRMKLTFISDPGHGWLQVSRAQYEKSGITASCYSYQSPSGKVYLEEDCDAPNFIRKIEMQGIKIEFKEKRLTKQSRIRNMRRIETSTI